MNPILQALNMTKPNNIMGLLMALKNGNPDVIFQRMMEDNPQFKTFVEQNKGKTAEQIAKENGIDMSMIKQFMR